MCCMSWVLREGVSFDNGTTFAEALTTGAYHAFGIIGKS